MKRKLYEAIRFLIAFAFLAATTACVVGMCDSTWLLFIQPGPLWVRLVAGVTALGVSAAIVLLVATFLFGRFFCAALCPFGTCQDIFGMVRSRRKTAMPNLRWVRYGIAGVSLLLLAGGWAILFRYLDPFSRFGAIVGSLKETVLGGGDFTFSYDMIWNWLLPLLIPVVLVIWKRRIYCVSLCPVGTIFGVAAKYSIWRMRIQGTCDGCGRCDAICPTGCVDSAAKLVDAERCVVCMKCASACPNGSMIYASAGRVTFRQYPEDGDLGVDRSRRKFLLAGFALVVGAMGVGRILSNTLRSIARSADNARGLIFPPGAVDSERFARQCTGCQVCAINCPTGIIKPSPSGFGPVHLEYSHNGCEYNCTRCNAICPSGALQPLNLVDKQWLKIGEARIDLPSCRIVKDGITCDLCVKACPKRAIFIAEGSDGFGVPEVAAFHCIGCGVCQAICPVEPKAIIVSAVEQQPMGF